MIQGQRVTLIFIKDKSILLMYRFKDGVEYYVFPGGGVEEGETPEEAAVREAKEETSLDVEDLKKLWEVQNKDRLEHYFYVSKFEGSIKIAGPEADRQASDNVYRLEWIPFDKILELELKPDAMKQRVIDEVIK